MQLSRCVSQAKALYMAGNNAYNINLKIQIEYLRNKIRQHNPTLDGHDLLQAIKSIFFRLILIF